ncbi:hypothetical protein BDZ97DRAFT_1921224 [Flammula alnicola]|nr:hypothetical protein BDZ97DRAFT_1921224 [Flammula alnicola]
MLHTVHVHHDRTSTPLVRPALRVPPQPRLHLFLIQLEAMIAPMHQILTPSPLSLQSQATHTGALYLGSLATLALSQQCKMPPCCARITSRTSSRCSTFHGSRSQKQDFDCYRIEIMDKRALDICPYLEGVDCALRKGGMCWCIVNRRAFLVAFLLWGWFPASGSVSHRVVLLRGGMANIQMLSSIHPCPSLAVLDGPPDTNVLWYNVA